MSPHALSSVLLEKFVRAGHGYARLAGVERFNREEKFASGLESFAPLLGLGDRESLRSGALGRARGAGA
jgi:hypothetical protein